MSFASATQYACQIILLAQNSLKEASWVVIFVGFAGQATQNLERKAIALLTDGCW